MLDYYKTSSPPLSSIALDCLVGSVDAGLVQDKQPPSIQHSFGLPGRFFWTTTRQAESHNGNGFTVCCPAHIPLLSCIVAGHPTRLSPLLPRLLVLFNYSMPTNKTNSCFYLLLPRFVWPAFGGPCFPVTRSDPSSSIASSQGRGRSSGVICVTARHVTMNMRAKS
jgi:hypothetical protein